MSDFLGVLGLAARCAGRRLRGVRLHPDWDATTQIFADGARFHFRGLSRSVAHARERADAIVLPPALVAGARIEAGEVGGVPGEWVHPKRGAGADVLLYFHGGGYVVGSPATHRSVTGTLAAEAGIRVFAPDYRLAPEHPYPAPLDDCVAAYRGLLERGIPADRIALAGDSAGGGLVMATLLVLRDAGDPLPRAAIPISPWVDHSATGGSLESNAPYDYLDGDLLDWFSGHYRAGADPRDPRVSPLHADLAGLPPLLVQAGGAEILEDQVRALAERAGTAGVDVRLAVHPSRIHVWHLFVPFVPGSTEAIREIADFLRPPAGRG